MQISHMPSARIQDHFADIPDPRQRPVMYPLVNIITIAICAVVGGADDFVAIAQFGRDKREWLEKFLDLSSGTPSHDRFNAIFAALDTAKFEACLLRWILDLQEISAGRIIAIDGKTLRGSYHKASGKSAIHMVSAWAVANHVCLGQAVVEDRGNEITAIPKLLQSLDLNGALVTIDAMGCQTAIAKKIVAGGGDYCLAVKGNQPKLHDGIAKFFDAQLEHDFEGTTVDRHETEERGHGRDEHRMYAICPVPQNLPDRARWANLSAIGIALSATLRDGKEHSEVRYYILSEYISGKRFAEAIRGHWGIENNLHWQLNVTFGEDLCRIRKGHADANFSILRPTALSLQKNRSRQKLGIKNKRLSSGWKCDNMEQVLVQQ